MDVVDQPPLLKELMNTDNRTDVTCQALPCLGGSDVSASSQHDNVVAVLLIELLVFLELDIALGSWEVPWWPKCPS